MRNGVVHIDLLGASFTIKTDEDGSYTEQLLGYIKERIAAVQDAMGIRDPLKVSIIAGLLLADELFKERQKHASGMSNEESMEVDRLAVQMIEKIDKCLQDGDLACGVREGS